MSWEVVAGVAAVTIVLAVLGFKAVVSLSERAEKEKQLRKQTKEDLDALDRFIKGERAARDDPAGHRARLRKLRRELEKRS